MKWFVNNELFYIRLTAFVVRSFQEASNYIFIDPTIITRSLSWLVTNQQANGAFAEPPEGRVIHTDMQVSVCVCACLCLRGCVFV